MWVQIYANKVNERRLKILRKTLGQPDQMRMFGTRDRLSLNISFALETLTSEDVSVPPMTVHDATSCRCEMAKIVLKQLQV